MYDLTGRKYTRITVLEFSHKINYTSYWKCRCDCGTIKIIRGSSLTSGATQSCGCYGKEEASKKFKKNLIGQEFHYLTVKQESGRTKKREVIYLCECICGNFVEVSTNSLTSGHTKSCGCYNKEVAKTRVRPDIQKIEIGRVFNRITIINYQGRGVYGCQCVCGTLKNIRGNHLISGAIQSCGCLNREIHSKRFKELHKDWIGPDHPRWNSNLTNEERLENRDTKENDDWAQSIYERDNYTCKACGQRGGSLNAHHLYSYCKYKEFRLDLNNGVCLCEKCHLNFHKIYGKGENTKAQFEEFLLTHIPQHNA